MNRVVNKIFGGFVSTNLLIVMFATIFVFIDQLSKFLADYLGLEVIFNKGASLGLLVGVSPFLIIVLSSLLLVLVFLFFRKDWLANKTFTNISAAFFFGGSVSNILDRLVYGAVRDWLKIPFFEVYNNLADWFIFIGLGMFFLFQIHEIKTETSVISVQKSKIGKKLV